MPKNTPQPKQEFTLPERPYKKIAVTFIILTVLLVIIIAYFSLSKATITLTPNQVAETKNFSLRLPLNTTSTPAAVTGKFTEKELEIAKSFEVKNFETQPGKSHGLITIINKHTQNQPLVATTRFLSPDGLLFRLKEYVVIPAKGEITAEIEADQPGSKYDIGPAHFSIPGLSQALQNKIYGISKQAMVGGVKKIGTLSAEEINQAQQETLATLDELIKQKLNITASDKNIVLLDKEIIDQQTSNQEGDKIEKFTVSVKVKAKAVEIDKTELLDWTKQQYKKELGGQNEIINYDLKSFAVNLEKVEDNLATIKVSLAAYVLDKLDIKNFEKQKLFGLDKEGVKYFFTQYNNIKDVQVVFWPFWVRSVPSLPDHILIKIQ